MLSRLKIGENFICHLNSTRFLESTGDTPPNPPSGLAASSGSYSHQFTSVESFKRIIKMDSSQFNNFEEGRHWDAWHRNILATSRAQDLDNVLHPNDTPLTQEDVKLFNEKQKFMCSVFSIKLKTD